MIDLNRRFAACFFIPLLFVSLTSAVQSSSSWEQENSLVWEYDFESGFISTAPIYHDGKIIVRTSGSDEPSVTALSVEGELIWKYTNSATLSNDMSPLVHAQAGTSSCGTWPELILVGWTDGTIDAIHPDNGTVHWSIQTEVAGWGITSVFSIEDGDVIVPTRTGVGQYCLADGQQQWWVETGLGWRNGVTATPQGYFSGDEKGNLWKITPQGNATVLSSFDGKIRHPPLETNAGLLVHVQHPLNSSIVLVNSNNGDVIQEFISGPSPAMPVLQNEMVITGDSSSLNIFSCQNSCELINTFPHHTNGEIGVSPDGSIVAPTNTPNANWGMISFVESRDSSYSQIDIGIYGYGTSSPLWFFERGANYTVFGNDQSLLRVFQQIEQQPPSFQQEEFDWGRQGLLFVMYMFLSMSAIFFLNGNSEWFLRSTSVLFLLIILLILPELSSQWSKTFDEQFPQESLNEDWNEEWPESWLETQMVTFDIEGQTYTVGGLSGYGDVYSLTEAATGELGFEFTAEKTEIGWYISSINGHGGDGWEYFVDGTKGVVSADKTPVDSPTRVRWVSV